MPHSVENRKKHRVVRQTTVAVAAGQLYSQGIHNDDGYITTEGLNVGTSKVGTKNQPTMQVYSNHVGFGSAINQYMVPGPGLDSCPININNATSTTDCILGYPKLGGSYKLPYASLRETTSMHLN